MADGIEALDIRQKEAILKVLENAFCVISATGIKHVVSQFFEKEDFAQVQFLTNMGSEDEYGDKFSEADILFNFITVRWPLLR